MQLSLMKVEDVVFLFVFIRPTSYDVTSGVAASLTGTSSVDSSFVESHELYTGSSDESSSQTSILPYPRKLRVDKKLSHSLIIGESV